MHLGIPENINPAMFTKTYRDRCLYFIHKVSALQYVNENLNGGDFVILSHSILNTDLFGGNYRKVIRELLLRGIIEKRIAGYASFNYGRTNEVMSYRLTEKYRYKYLQWIEVKDLKLKKKLQVYRQTLSARESMFINSLNKLEFDFDRAIQYVNSNYEYNSNQHKRRIALIKHLRNDKLFCLTDNNKPQRLYTSFSIMPKDLRQFFKNDLQQFDLSSSQLYHFIPDLIKYRDRTVNGNHTQTDKYHNEITGGDVEIFIELISSGEFFNYAMKSMNFKGTKREFKNKFFAEFWYCDLNHMVSPLRNFLECNFPTVSNAIKYYKQSLTFPYEKKAERFKNFPIRMQILERENIVDDICSKLIKENPEMVIIPNQDAIYCDSKHGDYVYNLMMNTLTEKINHKPYIKYA